MGRAFEKLPHIGDRPGTRTPNPLIKSRKGGCLPNICSEIASSNP